MANKSKKIKEEDFLDYLAKNKLPNQTQIAKHFNISKRTILRYLEYYELPRQLLSKTPLPSSANSALQIKILACYKFNKKINDICKATKTSKYLVKQIIGNYEKNRYKKTTLLKNKDCIKNFVEAELQISSQSEDNHHFHRENGKAIFGNYLDEAIGFIHKSIAIQKKLNGYVHEETADILVKMFAEQLKIDLSK